MPPIPNVPPHTAGYYQAFFTEHFGAAMGKAYAGILKKDPSATPTQAAQALLVAISTKGVAGALAQGIGGLGKIATPPPNPLGIGGANDNTSGSDWQHLFTRLAEFAIGATLIVVGLVAVMSKTKTGQAVTGLAVNVAGVTPPGRAVRTASMAERRAVSQRATVRAREINKQRYPKKNGNSS
jgi:hypothetical protein